MSSETSPNHSATLIFDPKNIRSRFAAFDPEHAESSDLLKARGGAVRAVARYRAGR